MSKIAKKREMDIVANNLAQLLAKHNKKQADIVRDLGMSQSVVSDYLKANRYPPPDKMQMLADYFGVMKSDIMEEKPAPQEDELSEKQLAVIEKLKSLNPDNLSLADDFLDVLTRQQNGQK